MTKHKTIARLIVPAIGASTHWVRTMKTIYVSQHTPKWMLDIILDCL